MSYQTTVTPAEVLADRYTLAELYERLRQVRELLQKSGSSDKKEESQEGTQSEEEGDREAGDTQPGEVGDTQPEEDETQPEEPLKRPIRGKAYKSTSRADPDSDASSPTSNDDSPEGEPPSKRFKTRILVEDEKACNSCVKNGARCYKPQIGRRTACRTCHGQKQSCSWSGAPRPNSRRPAAGSSKIKGNLEGEVQEYSIQEFRRDLVDVERAFAGLKDTHARLFAGFAVYGEKLDKIAALSLGMQAGEKGELVDNDAEMEIMN